MVLSTNVSQLLGVRYPILSAPMDLIAGARLTAAVSKAGGFGILGGGYGDETWLETELTELGQLLHDTSAPFGVGFITWSIADRPHLLDLALRHKPRAIMLSFGDPKPMSARIKDAGALLICQVQSEQMAEEALEAGADVLVAQGTEAGGHGSDRTTFDIVRAISDFAAGRVPVVAAGGVADGRGFASSCMLGAEGVLMGTRFYASEEADGHAEAKKRICEAKETETVRGILFDLARQRVWPAPFTGRCLVNQHVERWKGNELELLQNIDRVSAEYETAKADGNFDVAAVIAGHAVGLIDEVLSAEQVIENVVREAEQLLGRSYPAS